MEATANNKLEAQVAEKLRLNKYNDFQIFIMKATYASLLTIYVGIGLFALGIKLEAFPIVLAVEIILAVIAGVYYAREIKQSYVVDNDVQITLDDKSIVLYRPQITYQNGTVISDKIRADLFSLDGFTIDMMKNTLEFTGLCYNDKCYGEKASDKESKYYSKIKYGTAKVEFSNKKEFNAFVNKINDMKLKFYIGCLKE